MKFSKSPGWWSGGSGDASGDYQAMPAPPAVENPIVPEAEVIAVDTSGGAPPPVVVNLSELRMPEDPGRRGPPRPPAEHNERRMGSRLCGTCATGLCICLVVIVSVVLACVYGILNAPNLNVKGASISARGGTLTANLHNTNPYRVTIKPVDALVWLKAGSKRPLASFAMKEAVTLDKYSGKRVAFANSTKLDPATLVRRSPRARARASSPRRRPPRRPAQAKVLEKCTQDGSAKLKFHGSAKVKQSFWTRQREVVSQWQRAPCAS